MTRALAAAILVAALAPSDARAQRISTWDEPPRPAATDSLQVDADAPDLVEQAVLGAVIGSVAGVAGRADAADTDVADPLGTNAARAYDASVFDVLDFTLTGAVSAAITAAATEWARDRLTE